MKWVRLSLSGKAFLLGMYLVAVPSAYACFVLPATYSLPWFLLTSASVFVASVNLRLPKTESVVISMGDVFTILSLMHFGAGPALVTYWVDVTIATLTDYWRRYRHELFRKILIHRFLFNLASCTIAVLAMSLSYSAAIESGLPQAARLAAGLFLIAVSWFGVNTVALAAAISFWSDRPFMAVWREAVGLYLLNFFGSAAFAGLISFYRPQFDVQHLIFAVPVALVFYRLYRYHIKEHDQTQQHITQLNGLYQEAIRTRDALRQSEEQYRSLVEAASDAIFSLSPDFRISSLNTAFQAITGWQREAWIGRLFQELIHPADVPAVLETLNGVFKRETRLLTEVRVRHASGSYVVVDCTMTPQMQDGKIVGLLGIARDMTERMRLEQSLRQSQKMEAIGRLAGGIAHDFNNLLVVIIGYSSLALENVDRADACKPMLEEINKAGERAAALTHRLLVFSRKQIIQPVALNLNGIVKDMDKMLRRLIGEDIEVLDMLDASPAVIRADASQIEQIVLNLVINSRDAMPSGGTLTIATRNVDQSEVYEAVQTDVRIGRYIMLSVSDSGCGIPSEIRNLIFEPFFTTKEPGKGTGLGLATVYGIVTQNGGYIAVDSTVGKGTTFKIFLPGYDDEEVSASRLQIRQDIAQPVQTVLLVEDEDDVRNLASTILVRNGYRVLEARGGDEAIQIARRHSGTIHALVTDVVMPQMSGRQLADLIQTARPDIKVLYMSGHSDEMIRHHAGVEPGSALLHKPFSPAAFALKVRELLSSTS
jgi:PAS domain S-box-containing protein